MKKLTNYASTRFLLGFAAVAIMLAVGGVVAITASPASAQTTVVYVHSVTLRAGSSGPVVVNLQAALNHVNVGMPSLVLDGRFGPRTLAAVRQFQAARGLAVDGIVGPRTGQALAAAVLTVVPPGTGLLPAGCTSSVDWSKV
jgi:peptidoglycan DL-endopeptidase CwlO